MSCAVCGTTSKTKKQTEGVKIRFFRFPREFNRCKAWADEIKIERINKLLNEEGVMKVYNSNYRVCSRHFTKNAFMDPSQSMLRRDAVPCVTSVSSSPRKSIREKISKVKDNMIDVAMNIEELPTINSENTNSEVFTSHKKYNDLEIVNIGKQYFRWCGMKSLKTDEQFAEVLLDMYEKIMKNENQQEVPTISIVSNLSKSVQVQMDGLTTAEAEKKDYLEKLERLEPSKRQYVNVLRCDFCSYATTDSEKFQEHAKCHENEEKDESPKEQKLCKLCGMTCMNSRTLHAHMYRRHQFLEHHCPIDDCGFFSKYDTALQNHMDAAHSNERNHMCSYCGMKFKRPDHLRRHETTHTRTDRKRPRPHRPTCNLCQESFHSEARFRIHNASYHSSDGGFDGQFRCPIDTCNFRNSSELNVLKHFNSHHSHVSMGDGQGRMLLKKMFRCTYCSKVLTSYAGRLNHELRHRGQRNFACDMCDRKFYGKAELNTHKRMRHSDYRPFKCSSCNLSFKRLYTKQRHELTHTGEKPFTCRHCDAAYADYHTRKLHENKVHGIKLVNTKKVCLDNEQQ